MNLTREENEMLAGKHGVTREKFMRILLSLGECYDAEEMIPVSSAHILYSLTALGKGGSLLIQDIASSGAKFSINTHTNPTVMDPILWKDLGVLEDRAQEQAALASALKNMGAMLSDTCTPYLIGHIPLIGEHVAWSESSAIVFANSVLGARTNREGGPSALAAALTGRVPRYGYHLDENRYGDLKIKVTAKMESAHDYGTLGFFAGKMAQDKVPVFVGISPPVSLDCLKLLGAAAATSGSVALFHVLGVTPEAQTEKAAFGRKKIGNSQTVEFGGKELRETEETLCKATDREVDLVVFGCPHASIIELREIAELIAGRKVKTGVELWICTSKVIKAYAVAAGYVQILETSGARIISDTCPVLMSGGVGKGPCPKTIATDSAKLVSYISLYAAAKGQEILPYYGSHQRCVEAGISGMWR